MIFHKTKIDGVYIIEIEPKIDERGSFARIFCQEELAKQGLKFDIVQANISMTFKKGVIRGLHFQKEPMAEDKIVQCLEGRVYDVAVDLRKNSPTYGQWVSLELSGESNKMFLIPKGCAHGFQALEDNCRMQYFMSEFYSAAEASGVRWDDPFFGIKWPIGNPFLSEKDKNWPLAKK